MKKSILALLMLTTLGSVAGAEFRDGDIIPHPRGDNSSTIYIYAPSKKTSVHCRFNEFFGPGAYLRYDADKRRVWVESGWPRQWRMYQNVMQVTGAPPYYDQGLTLLAFGGDIPIVSFRIGSNPRNYQKHFEQYEIQAAWGGLPNMKPDSRGTCETETLPAVAVAATSVHGVAVASKKTVVVKKKTAKTTKVAAPTPKKKAS